MEDKATKALGCLPTYIRIICTAEILTQPTLLGRGGMNLTLSTTNAFPIETSLSQKRSKIAWHRSGHASEDQKPDAGKVTTNKACPRESVMVIFDNAKPPEPRPHGQTIQQLKASSSREALPPCFPDPTPTDSPLAAVGETSRGKMTLAHNLL